MAFAVAAAACLAPTAALAQAQVGNLVGSAIGLIGGIVANNKLQRDIAGMSSPLQYHTDVPVLDPNNPRDLRNFDVAGVRIGMTPDQAAQALRASRYVEKERMVHPSFDSEVRNRVNMGKATPVRAIEVPYKIVFTSSNSQEVAVGFVSLPDGPVVDSVSFGMTSDAMTPDAFAAQVQSKYGEPIQGDGNVLLWCVGQGNPCEGNWNHRPYMKVSLHEKHIELSNVDDDRDAALQARIDAEVAARQRSIQSAQF